jgi:hypothetical protein
MEYFPEFISQDNSNNSIQGFTIRHAATIAKMPPPLLLHSLIALSFNKTLKKKLS